MGVARANWGGGGYRVCHADMAEYKVSDNPPFSSCYFSKVMTLKYVFSSTEGKSQLPRCKLTWKSIDLYISFTVYIHGVNT